MDGGTAAPMACAGAVVIRRWLVITSGRCPDGRLGAYVASTERVNSRVPMAAEVVSTDVTEGLWADVTCFTSKVFETCKLSDLSAFLEAIDELERAGATVLDAEVWQAIKRAAARRIIRLESEHAFTG